MISFDGANVEVIYGEGLDTGTVALQIGDACVWFSSLTELVARLTGVSQSTTREPFAIVV